MQLSDLRAEVLAHGFDSTQFGSSRVNNYLNDGLQEMCARVNFYQEEATSDFATVSGTATYALPANFGRVRSLRDTGNTRELQSCDLREIDRSTASTGAPRFYAMDAANVHVYPSPDGVYSLELRFWQTPPTLINDTDVPAIPSRWHKGIWQYAVAEAYQAEDDEERANTMTAKFENTLAKFAADVKFPDTDRPNVVKGFWDQGSSLGSPGWSLYGSSWE